MKICHMKFITLLLLLPMCAFSSKYLPLSIEQNNNQFERCKDFTLRYGYLIKVAEIGWYAPDCEKTAPILQADNKVIRFHYLKNVSADFFKKSAEEYFLLNLKSPEHLNLLKPLLLEFNANYTDIKAGEYFDLVQINDSTLSLFKNKELLAVSTNKLFSNHYFNIWFGTKPVVDKLKAAFDLDVE